MSKPFFSSDFHYHHNNIVAGTTNWSSKERCRNFSTLEEHDGTLVHNINQTVGKDDVLYFMGDWSFGGLEFVKEFRDKIYCKTIHLILGNHDHHIEKNRFYNGVSTWSLFDSINHYKRKTINGQDMVLSHYSFRTWDKAHKGTWMLHGHSHGTLPPYEQFKTMDVGIDTHPDFRPYSFKEIQEIMSEKKDLRVDHHTEETN